MKDRNKRIVIVALAALMLSGTLQAEQRDRGGEVRGIFVRLTEQKVGEQGYMGIVLKPFDSDEHVTVLVPRNHEELMRSTRELREGTKLEISFVTEGGHKWIRTIKAELRQEQREEEGPEGEKRIIIRRETRRRDGEFEENVEARRGRATRRDPGSERPRGREGRVDRRPEAHLEQLQRQLRDVVSGHLDRMSRSLREVLADHLWRMDAEFRELRARVDRMERELDELRAENERLRRQLRASNPSRNEREEPARERSERRSREEPEGRRNRDERRESPPSSR
jgi:hypothetical protein